MSNKDEFNRIAAVVLGMLDEAFPVAIVLKAEEIIDIEDNKAVDIFLYSMIFLQRQDIISFTDRTIDGSRFAEVMLTGKGLALLNSVPDVIKEKTTLRQRIGNALKSGSKEVLKTSINQLVQAVAKGSFDLPTL
jgi:hypothetical protein